VNAPAVPPPNLPCLVDLLEGMLRDYTTEEKPMPRRRLKDMIHRLVNAGLPTPKVRWTDAQLRVAKEELTERGIAGSGPRGWYYIRTHQGLADAIEFLKVRERDLHHKAACLATFGRRRLGAPIVSLTPQQELPFPGVGVAA
jgi:hypothetical protein